MEAQDHEKISCTVAGDLELLRRYQNGDQEALEELLISHLPLIDFWANKLAGRIRWLTREDRRHQGVVGFIEAAREFDVTKNEDFDNKARKAIKRAFRPKEITPVRRHRYRNARRVLKAQRELLVELDRRPTNEELATRAKLSVRQLNNALEVIAALPFLLGSEKEGDRVEVEDLFEFDDPYDVQLVSDLLKRINRNDAIVIVRFYFYGQTDREIAKDLGRSTEGITMARHRAIRKLKAINSGDKTRKKDGI